MRTDAPISRSNATFRLAGAALVFAAGLCAAILAGSFEAREQGRRPNLGAQIRSLRGVSSTELAEQQPVPAANAVDATLLANDAARADADKAREQAHTRNAFSEPVVSTAHHQRRSSL